jgi:regulator of protease activity HflC (stomatin/prohibitin superfamily)
MTQKGGARDGSHPPGFAYDPASQKTEENPSIMNRLIPQLIVTLTCTAALLATGCTRIETGEVGLRINFDKTTDPTERLPGSFNQTLIGDIVTFKIQDVAVAVDNMTPLASDNSTIKDFDMTVVYNITPTAVSELWTTKNKAFHGLSSDKSGDILLMQNYVALSARNAAYKVAREYESLKMADNRQLIEQKIRDIIIKTLTEEKLADKIIVSQVQVRAITPADVIVASANELVRAQNELKTKEVEVQTAKKEAERIAALNANAGAIGYMNAMANLKIAEGVASGKVHSIVVPYDFKGIVNAK